MALPDEETRNLLRKYIFGALTHEQLEDILHQLKARGIDGDEFFTRMEDAFNDLLKDIYGD